MAKLLKVLSTGTVDELIEALKEHQGKKISIFGSGLPIYVHEEGEHIILDETNLED